MPEVSASAQAGESERLPTRLYRDQYGVPHVRASSVLEVARAQGRVTARDRSWQIEWLRRRATGTTAAAVGEIGLSWDRFSRRMETVRTARRAFDACDEQTRQFVTAYVEGLNAGLATVDPADVPELSRLGIAAEAWEPWTPLANFLTQHLLFANLPGALWQRLTRAVLGNDAPLLSHEGALPIGSNAWGAGGGRTASGLPLIGGDPHRMIEQPGVYQQVRLACEDPNDAFDVVGFSFVGVPGVQHFAHAGNVAWAVTNASADYQDVREEAVTPTTVLQRRTDVIDVRNADPVEVEVLETPWGLVFENGLSVRTSSWRLGELGFDALLPLLRAVTVDDVDRALDRWVEPVNNVLIADRSGVLRYRIAGRVPVRDEQGDWTGWIDGPNRADVPADGHIVTANERRGPESAKIGSVFEPPYRAQRLHALLEGRTGLTADDYAAFHNDALLLTVPIMAALVPGEFDGFDGRMEAGSQQAGRYATWRSALVRRLAAEPVFAPLYDPPDDHRHDPLFSRWLDPTVRIGRALPALATAWTAGKAPFGIDLGALARAALEDIAEQLPRTWGETHFFTPQHSLESLGYDPGIPALSVAGDTECVRCTASYPGVGDECVYGSVARYVWDLADREAGGWIVPTGTSALPGPHSQDQLPRWAAGDLAPIVTDWAELKEESWT